MSVFSNKTKRVEALQTTTIFGGMPKKEVMAMERHVTAVSIEKGYEMARQDRAPQQMFVIATGSAVVKRNNRKIAVLGPGDTVGEMSLLDGGKQSATVIAETDCDVLVVPINEFTVLLDESPTFAKSVLKSLAVRLREADAMLGLGRPIKRGADKA